MAEDIPSPCDLIVVGTGLTESIVAAAASRIGKQVVHVDHRDFYGSSWATFSFNTIENTLGLVQGPEETGTYTPPNEDENTYINIKPNTSFCNILEKWHIPDEHPNNITTAIDNPPNEVNKQCWAKSEILKNARKFNFDISPKVLYSRGEMVEVLISSGICRYAEFKNVAGIYTYDDTEDELLSVPCSRADVFNTKDISMVEKRLLMKILSMCVDYETKPEEFKDFESSSFGDFLSSHKIKGKIRRYLTDSVAMVKDSTGFHDAVKSIQKFVRSIGRYGNTPFLWTLYGSGELPQCFCRCSAVFGGVYCLKRHTQSISVGNDGLATGIVSDNQHLKAKFILIEDCLNPLATAKPGISRAVLVTDKALAVNEQATLISYPSVDGKEPVKILELSPSTMACPKGLYVVHLVTRQTTTAVEDLGKVIETLFCSDQENADGRKPKIIWSLHFNVNEFDSPAAKLPSNVYSSPGPNVSIDFDDHVIQARKIFQSMFPNEEFLPRVPDPEDVIIEAPPEDKETPIVDATNAEGPTPE